VCVRVCVRVCVVCVCVFVCAGGPTNIHVKKLFIHKVNKLWSEIKQN